MEDKEENIEEKHKYKVGDKVKIRYMDPDKYSEPMVDCGGDIATITNIINSQGNIQYRVKENYYYWDEEMLEPVEENEEDNQIIINAYVSNEDMGRVIGKDGKIINSIRTILQASSYMQNNISVKLNVLEKKD